MIFTYSQKFIDPFRAKAAEQGIPPADVERWISGLRPFATLLPWGDGPVAGRWGGNPWLPADVPHPPFTLVASIDCAALPAEATDLPLPSDGQLLLFSNDDGDACCDFRGTVVYVPAGAAVAERPWIDEDDDENEDDDDDEDEDGPWPVESLRLTIVPYHPLHPAYDSNTPEHPHGKDLARAWEDSQEYPLGERGVQLGGFPIELNNGPIDAALGAADPTASHGGARPPVPGTEPPKDEDWVLLASADGTDMVNGGEQNLISWVIPRQDLAELRFDRVYVHLDGA
ncbi:DUF1963 domain-containing protein [Micromonospora sp. LH3U1]|uniref:DUF1963 domain-containing protein n=1 Tax=Micromonospora sp. LH3U1 TaxID=3018339 RepID=UPI00234B6093|nr:DUF1963 domain-containing protein [Micromonospora sp. LH3U1]WCN83244.1 DUF1963 domain-containing protein [Micromonospora sp. LH3U1]